MPPFPPTTLNLFSVKLIFPDFNFETSDTLSPIFNIRLKTAKFLLPLRYLLLGILIRLSTSLGSKITGSFFLLLVLITFLFIIYNRYLIQYITMFLECQIKKTIYRKLFHYFNLARIY
ncbi:hypothetical protein ES703_78279 [subsurface metagenome]